MIHSLSVKAGNMSLKEHSALQGSIQRVDWAGFIYCYDKMQVFDLTISGAMQKPIIMLVTIKPENIRIVQR